MFNVWHTLDNLAAGNDLQTDIHNWLKNFSKRDSFAGRDVSSVGKRQKSIDETTRYRKDSRIRVTSTRKSPGNAKLDDGKLVNENHQRKKSRRHHKKEQNQNKEKLPNEYGNIIDCSFNLPRISARLEKLMGTNVVRLTDRKYMLELGRRIQEDYNRTLQKRIESREEQEEERRVRMILNGHYTPKNCPSGLVIAHSIALSREMERERALLIEGKGEKISAELADHPLFIVNQRTNIMITTRRAKMKTNREKNAERLLRQGAKWERERLVYEEIEKQKDLEALERKRKEREQEEKYKQEDSVRGMDLLRIHDQEWKECEMDLKQFLETERHEMKKRFEKKGEMITNDSLDVKNIVRARQKFRLTERKIRQELDQQFTPTMQVTAPRDFLAHSAAGSVASRKIAEEQDGESYIEEVITIPEEQEKSIKESVLDGTGSQRNFDDDLSVGDEDGSSLIESITESQHIVMLQNDIENDAQKGRIATKSQYRLLRYEDPKVAKLKRANNVKDLYELAEEIIIGETETI